MDNDSNSTVFSAPLIDLDNTGIVDKGGNRVIITSRIVGNYSSKLNPNLVRVTLERMQLQAIRRFFHAWFRAIDYDPNSNAYEQLTSAQEDLASERAERLLITLRHQAAALDMAAVPLLASTLAALFYDDDCLPSSRTALCDKTIQRILKRWHEHMIDYSSGKIESLSEIEVYAILEPLAYSMHESGKLIHANDLRNATKKVLKSTRPELKSHTLIQQISDTFLYVVTNDVGLFALYGEDKYCFLHRHFQEYLAGGFLLRGSNLKGKLNLDELTKRLRDKLSDPIWRQPLYLALGQLSLLSKSLILPANLKTSHLLTTVVNYLIVDQAATDSLVFPQAAILIAEALNEFELSHSSAQTITQLLFEELFIVYTEHLKQQHGCTASPLLQRLANAMATLNNSRYGKHFKACVLKMFRARPHKLLL